MNKTEKIGLSLSILAALFGIAVLSQCSHINTVDCKNICGERGVLVQTRSVVGDECRCR